MNNNFEDRIDDYLLHRMNEEEEKAFLNEVEHDDEKKELLEFTRNVKDSICSREEKLKAMEDMRQQYERRIASEMACDSEQPSKGRWWFWLSGIAAVLVIGFFAFKPMLMQDSTLQKYDGAIKLLHRGNHMQPVHESGKYNNHSAKNKRKKGVKKSYKDSTRVKKSRKSDGKE